MILAFLLVTGLLLTVTLLPLLRLEAWWIRILDFPRLQFSFLALLLLILQALLLEPDRPLTWGLLAATLGCMAYQGWWIFPYTPLKRVEVSAAAPADSSQSLGIMTANVLGSNRNADGLLRLVKDHRPHVLVTLESNHWWDGALDDLEKDYPYSLKCPLDNLYGMHVFSRLPLRDGCVDFLLEEDVPSMHAFIEMPGGDLVGAHFLHPKPPSPNESLDSSERDAELVIVARQVAEKQAPVIVAGDLNDVAWSRTTRLFRKISGLRDPRVGRGMFNTFHAGYWFLRWPLDHLFHSRHFTVKDIRRLDGFGSDHFPLFTELVFTAPRANPDNAPEADEDDWEMAREKMADENVDQDDVPDRELPRQ